jgi:hypothetical protein
MLDKLAQSRLDAVQQVRSQAKGSQLNKGWDWVGWV